VKFLLVLFLLCWQIAETIKTLFLRRLW